MSFEPIRDTHGQPRMRCICDDCGRSDVVAAIHGKDGREGEGQAVTKVQALGWTYIGKRLRCGSCEAKRKAKNVKKPPFPQVTPAPADPTRAQRREIMDLLSSVYDTDAECYKRGDTDDTVADVLGVRPGWVADIREEFFGPAGGNQDMADLAARLDATNARMAEVLKEAQGLIADCNAIRADLAEMTKTLTAIREAVGPRILKKAGVN